MGLLVPAKDPFPNLLHNGVVTEGADGQLLTLPADGFFRSQWVDLGAGQTLAKGAWTTTATGSVLGRSSAEAPSLLEDRAILAPVAWNSANTYDPDLGTLPTSQGYSAVSSPSGSVAGGLLQIGGVGFYRQYSATALTAGKLIIVRFRMSLESGTGDQGLYCNLPVGTGTYNGNCQTYLTLSTDGTKAYIKYGPYTVKTVEGWAYSTLYDFALILRTSDVDVRPANYEIWYRPAGSHSQEDLAEWEFVGYGPTANADDYPQIAFGNVYNGGPTAKYGKIHYWSSPSGCDQNGFETLANPDTAFTAQNGRYWQLSAPSLVTGTLTSLQVAENTSTPGTPAAPTAAATLAGDVVASLTAAPANTTSYLWQLHNGAAVVQTLPSTTLAISFPDPGDGTYTVRVWSIRGNGILSVAAGESDPVTLPAVTPTVTLTVDDPTLAPGEVASITATYGGGVTGTLNGDPLAEADPTPVAEATVPLIQVLVTPSLLAPSQDAIATATLSHPLDLELNGDPWDGTEEVVATAEASAPVPVDIQNNLRITVAGVLLRTISSSRLPKIGDYVYDRASDTQYQVVAVDMEIPEDPDASAAIWSVCLGLPPET